MELFPRVDIAGDFLSVSAALPKGQLGYLAGSEIKDTFLRVGQTGWCALLGRHISCGWARLAGVHCCVGTFPVAGQGFPWCSSAVEIFPRVSSASWLAPQEWGASCVQAGQQEKSAVIDGFLKVVRPVCKDGRQFLSKHMWCGG